MRVFRFPLEKVLDWRRTQLEVAEAELRKRAAALAAVDRERALVEAAAVAAEIEVRRASSVDGAELAALDEFRRHVHSQERMLAARRAECERRAAAQEAAMLEARRRCRLLERLRERRWSEWKAEADRELEQVAAESYLARWNATRRRRAAAPSEGRLTRPTYNEMHDP